MEIDLKPEERRFFRDQLREARAGALLDAEGFHPIVTALEHLGSMLCPSGQGLGRYQHHLLAVARRASAAPVVNDQRGEYTPLEVLYRAVTEGRNDAVHQGAYVRHLVRHCFELALLVEEGLMADFKAVADFMVRDPVCAEVWQPVALARQRMLTSSFSYLLLLVNGQWKLISDHAVACYLSKATNRRQALRQRISEVCKGGTLNLQTAVIVGPETPVDEALGKCEGRPVLVVEEDHLLGIAAPFDFL